MRVGDGAGDEFVDLQQAAERLGVHYMTAYRYVRLGRLPATKEAGQWKVSMRALQDMAGALSPGPPGGRRGRPRLDVHRNRLVDRLLAGDEPGAWAVLEAARAAGVDLGPLHLELLAPVLRLVGDRWASGELAIGDEHVVSSVATRLVGRLGPLMSRPGRRRGVVVVGGAPGDVHTLPCAILANLLRGAQYEVLELGGSTPVASFVDAARQPDAPLAVCVSTSLCGRDDVVELVVAEVHQAASAPVLVGGPGVDGPGHANRLGADGTAPDGPGLVAILDGLWEARRKQREHAGAGDAAPGAADGQGDGVPPSA
jgi:excisionase family DNA binding protein